MLIGIILAVAAATSCADSATNPPSAFVSTFDGVLWGGETAHYRSDVSVADASGKLIVSVASASQKNPVSGNATLTKCGEIGVPAKLAQVVSPYNNAVALRGNMPANIAVGQTWRSTVSVFVAPKQSMDVPVTVTYAKRMPNGAILLQAVGAGEGTLTDYGTPFDLKYQAAALFDGSSLKQANSAAQEAVQAGPQSQTMKFNWSIATTK
jgi:hypothetical protein